MSYPKFDEAKDPEDLSDHEITFSDNMPADDAILSVDDVTITADKQGDPSSAADLTVQSRLFSGQSAILWLAGGKPGWRYMIAALVRTVGGRAFRRRALLDVRQS